MTLEAAAGKNPVSHVAKIYNLLAHQMAVAIWSQVDGLDEVYVWMCSQIGEPVDRPWQISVQLALSKGATVSDIEPSVVKIVRDHLDNVTEFSARLSRGEFPVC